jgi:hypothetical protein
VRSGESGRRRRETSCPSIHRAPGLIPRGREIGREPRARVQVDRLVGWQKSVGSIAICIGRSSPKEAPRTLTRARGGGRVNRYATLRTEHSRSARSRPRKALALCVSEHDRRRLGSRQYVPFTGFMRRGLGPAGFSKLRDGWGRFVWCLQDDFETSEVGSIAMKALPAPEARRVSRTQAQWLMSLCVSERTASTSSPSKLAGLNTTPPSPRVQAARTALGLERPPPSP